VTVALIDYRAGNLTSVEKGLAAVGAEVRIVETVDGLAGAHAIVVPGVGHFAATAALDDAWKVAIRKAVLHGTPLLGICLGLQWLFEGSREAPEVPGLGLFEGRCFELSGSVKVPHVGWNTLEPTGRPSKLLADLPSDASAYFTHSFAAPVGAATVATTMHGVRFASIVERGPVAGVQFHPEKSGTTGLRLLRNFLSMAGEERS
jgi:glutamine amidotransferase